MPSVTKEELAAFIKQCAEGQFSAEKLSFFILQFAGSDHVDQLGNKKVVIDLIKPFKKIEHIDNCLKYLLKKLEFPSNFNWKNALYHNPPYQQFCFDSHARTQRLYHQFWSGAHDNAEQQNLVFLETKEAYQRFAIAACGNSTAICITLSHQKSADNKSRPPGINLSRHISKWLVRFFNYAKSPDHLISIMSVVLEEIAKLINQYTLSESKNIYGVAMRLFPSNEQTGAHKLVYCGVGNCDLFLLTKGTESSLKSLIVAQEIFDKHSFLSKGFREPNAVSYKMLNLEPDDQVIFTIPPALAKFTNTAPLQLRSNGSPRSFPPREMRLSQKDLRLLIENDIVGYSYPCDLAKLHASLTRPERSFHDTLLQLTEQSFKHRKEMLLSFINHDLRYYLEDYEAFLNKEENKDYPNGQTLLGLFNWRDKHLASENIDNYKYFINMLLYYFNYEYTPAIEIPLAKLKEIVASPPNFPQLPPNCFVTRSGFVPSNFAAQIKIAYNKIDAQLEQTRRDQQRRSIDDSRIINEIENFLTQLKIPNVFRQLFQSKETQEFYKNNYDHFEKIKMANWTTPAEQLYELIVFLLGIARSDSANARYIKQESMELLFLLIKKFINPTLEIAFGFDESFVTNLHLHAMDQRYYLQSTPWKSLFLEVAQLKPCPSPKSPGFTPHIEWPKQSTLLSPIEGVLAAWLKAQENHFRDCHELQTKLDLHKNAHPFIDYLQALLMLNTRTVDQMTNEEFKTILHKFKTASSKAVTHATVALLILLRDDYCELFFEKTPCFEDYPTARNGTFHMDWAAFLVSETQRLILPDHIQQQALQVFNDGAQSLMANLESSRLHISLQEHGITISGYLALFLLLRKFPLQSMWYAITAISKSDPLGLYVAVRLNILLHLNCKLKNNFLEHTPFVALLFEDLKLSPIKLQCALQKFAMENKHPVAAYLGSHPSAFFGPTEEGHTLPDIKLLGMARTAGILDSAKLYSQIPEELTSFLSNSEHDIHPN